MAFPVVKAVNGGFGGASTTHTINLPAGIVAGDLLLVCLVTDAVAVTTPSGWTLLLLTEEFNPSLRTYYRIADGSEGSTITITSGGFGSSAHTSFRIDLGDKREAVGVWSSPPNPPSLSPSWGAQDTLWIAVCAYGPGTTAVTSYPTDYTNGRNDRWNDASGFGVGSAYRSVRAASEDPGPFGLSPSGGGNVQTIAVSPRAFESSEGGALSDVVALAVSPGAAPDGALGSEVAILDVSHGRIDLGAGSDPGALQATAHTLADQVTGADLPATLQVTHSHTDQESGSGDASALVATLAASDVGSETDQSSLECLVAPSDQGAATEPTSLVGLIALDSGGDSEATSQTAELAATDAGAEAEASIVGLDDDDAASGSDASAPVAVGSSDSGSGTDTSVRLADQSAGTDSGAGADNSDVGIASSDVGAFAETAGVLSIVLGSDAALGVDAATFDVDIAAGDSAGTVESSAQAVQIPVSDGATGNDVLELIVVLVSNDVYTDDSMFQLQALYTPVEAGAGIDIAAIAAARASDDVGAASDTQRETGITAGDIAMLEEQLIIGPQVFDSGTDIELGAVVTTGLLEHRAHASMPDGSSGGRDAGDGASRGYMTERHGAGTSNSVDSDGGTYETIVHGG